MDDALARMMAEIAGNRVDGAALLALRVLDILERFSELRAGDAAETADALRELVRGLSRLRPAMGAIGAQALLVYDDVLRARPVTGEALRRAIVASTIAHRAALAGANEAISAAAVRIVGTGRRILTCSHSSTVSAVITRLSPAAVIVGEGAPLRDGVRAYEAFAARGLPATVVVDGVLAQSVSEADAVLVGADQVLADGGVVNRASTHGMALAAKTQGIPVYVVCQRVKISGRETLSGDREHLPYSVDTSRGAVDVHAPLFDVTPPSLVTAVITESGVLDEDEIVSYSSRMSRIRATL